MRRASPLLPLLVATTAWAGPKQEVFAPAPPRPSSAGSCAGYITDRGADGTNGPIRITCADGGGSYTLDTPYGTTLPKGLHWMADGHITWDANGAWTLWRSDGIDVDIVPTGPAPAPVVAAPVAPTPAAPMAAPAPAPVGGRCATPAGAATVSVTVVNIQTEPVTVFLVDPSCVEIAAGTLQPKEERAVPTRVEQRLVVRTGTSDPSGRELQVFWPIASDPPSLKIASRPMKPVGPSCPATFLGTRPDPTGGPHDKILFRCDGRAVVVDLGVGMMSSLPRNLPPYGTRGTLVYDTESFESFTTDAGVEFRVHGLLE